MLVIYFCKQELSCNTYLRHMMRILDTYVQAYVRDNI